MSLGFGNSCCEVSRDQGKAGENKVNQLVESTKLTNYRSLPSVRFQTVWAACRAVIFGCIVIAVGLAMTVLGYFDKQFSERVEIVDGAVNVYHDRVVQYQLKSMQYLGPILMGIGSFILIIACVVTLESRDKHAQIITEESMTMKKRRLMSIEERTEVSVNEIVPDIDDDDIDNDDDDDDSTTPTILDVPSGINLHSISTMAEVHRPRSAAARQAPLADIDSLVNGFTDDTCFNFLFFYFLIL
ncbi:unnamed protein product [Nippostrongylus brasiliensis]|uniref:Col_cuticle_N domain-containing protein n=1 Tax=Nippostrongylus brasiliensis TaxID=27835 RepID=A0A0N4XDD0_NIPBR|nr:unnamed protein product [Nippostrongylus brasiliensis]